MRGMLALAVVIGLAVRPGVRADEPAPAKPPAFKVPKGWDALEAGKTGVASLVVAARFQAGKEVTTTVTGTAGEGGGLANNVNRWRHQLGLDGLDETGALKSLESLKVGGVPVHRLDASGAEVSGKPAQRIVAVVVKNGDTTWFIKMMGPGDAVEKQKAAFDEFVKSVRFEK